MQIHIIAIILYNYYSHSSSRTIILNLGNVIFILIIILYIMIIFILAITMIMVE